jgi:hypothetical protein
MKKSKWGPEIEELLNGYIDGELSAEDCARVRQLISENKLVARRLRKLERCRLLVSSLPPAEPPAGLVAGIKRMLDSKTAEASRRHYTQQRLGAQHLLIRQVLAASVIIGLVGLLGAVLYKIVGPEGMPKPAAVAVREGTTRAERPEPAEAAARASAGIYSLQLTTAEFVAVDAFINRLLEESTWLRYEANKQQQDRSVYKIYCSRAGLEGLMADMAPVWSRFDSATFVVHTEEIARLVAVEQVRPEQITQIAKKDTLDARIRLAKDFAVFNSIEQFMKPEVAEGDYPGPLTIPKPVLTSAEKRPARAPEHPEERVRVDLTIVVSALPREAAE